MTFNIRKITEADRCEYINMAREFYSSPAVIKNVPEKNFAAAFEECLNSDAYAECYILECDGDTAGYGLILKSYSQEAGGKVIWFDELFVKLRYRGLGFGSKFFEYIFANLPAARYRLEVEKENLPAVNLYKKLGFKFLQYDQMIKENN